MKAILLIHRFLTFIMTELQKFFTKIGPSSCKKVVALLKIYRKSSFKHFGIDPLEAVEKECRKSNGAEDEEMS